MKPALFSRLTAGRLALALWILSLLVAGWFFIFGQTGEGGADKRTIIQLKPAERQLVLREMRGLLAATHGIVEALSQQDMQRVTQAAQAAGMASAADVNPALMAKLPLSFKSLGMSVHRDMDDLARAAAAGETESGLLKRLSGTLSKCVACHASWQLGADTSIPAR